MNRKNTTRPPVTPPENREGSSHYFTPAREKVRGAVEFSIERGWSILKKIFSEPSTLLGNKVINFLKIALLLAGYITSLTMKTRGVANP